MKKIFLGLILLLLVFGCIGSQNDVNKTADKKIENKEMIDINFSVAKKEIDDAEKAIFDDEFKFDLSNSEFAKKYTKENFEKIYSEFDEFKTKYENNSHKDKQVILDYIDSSKQSYKFAETIDFNSLASFSDISSIDTNSICLNEENKNQFKARFLGVGKFIDQSKKIYALMDDMKNKYPDYELFNPEEAQSFSDLKRLEEIEGKDFEKLINGMIDLQCNSVELTTKIQVLSEDICGNVEEYKKLQKQVFDLSTGFFKENGEFFLQLMQLDPNAAAQTEGYDVDTLIALLEQSYEFSAAAIDEECKTGCSSVFGVVSVDAFAVDENSFSANISAVDENLMVAFAEFMPIEDSNASIRIDVNKMITNDEYALITLNDANYLEAKKTSDGYNIEFTLYSKEIDEDMFGGNYIDDVYCNIRVE